MHERRHAYPSEDPVWLEISGKVGQNAEHSDAEVSNGQIGQEEIGDRPHATVKSNDRDDDDVPC